MPTSVPPSDDTPRPRLWGDTYLHADRRHLAEAAATRLLEMTMPVTSTNSGTRSPTQATVAISEAGVAHADTAECGGAAKPAFIPEPGREEPLIEILPGHPNPLASFRSEIAVRPHPPSLTAAGRFRPRPTGRDRAALFPVTALGTLTIVVGGALGMMFWPGGDAEAPAVTQSAEARAESQPVRTAASGNDATPSAVATGSGPASVAPAQVLATPDAARPAAKAPPRRTSRPAVARASNQSSTPVTPVSRPSVAQLRVTSNPSGARVTINGIGWGQTPVTVTNLPLGAKTVRVTIDGYRSQQRTVDLRSAGDSTAVHMALKADGGTVNR